MPCSIDRRRLSLLAAAGALAGCAPRARPARRDPLALHAEVLTRGFPSLAARARPALFNLGVLQLADDRRWCFDETARMPMQSVFKAPLAAAALAEIDAGRMRLDERIHLTALDLSPGESTINRAWPTPPSGYALDLPVADLIALAVQKSDNTAADAIMKRIGGPGAVTAWLRQHQINDLRIDRYERVLQPEIHAMAPFRPEWKDEAAWAAARDAVPVEARAAATAAYLADPRDTATVPAALEFLRQLAEGELLSASSSALLLRLMETTTTGLHRLRAGLPPEAIFAHKTGTAGTDLGLTPAVGDIGLVFLPGRGRFAIAAFLAGSTATEAARERLFADAARLACQAFGV